MLYLYRPIGLFMEKGTNTRERIIEKSAELFSLYGYHGCSLNDIMEATQLKKGGIYNHFPNKDAIALEAFDYSLQKMIKRFRERLDLDSTSKQKLNSLIQVFASFVDDPVVAGGCPIFNTAVDSDHTHPELKKKAVNGMNTLKNYIMIKIGEGQKTGEFKKNADPEEVANLMIMTLEGALIMARVYRNDKPMRAGVNYVEKYLKENLYQ